MIDLASGIEHPELGLIVFHDGKAIPPWEDGEPMWICFPHGLPVGSEFKIYLPGDSRSPKDLEIAIDVMRHWENIEAEGRRMGGANISLAWVDIRTLPPTVAFPDNDQVYSIWRGWLDYELRIKEFTEGVW